MLILLSPSKSLDFEKDHKKIKATKPRLIEHSEKLTKELKKMSQSEISEMMNISEKLSELNHKRFQNWKTPFDKDNAKQAILAFSGDVYRDIETDKFDEKDLEFAQKHVRTLSGLYGMLRPLDLIQPYRLEMKYRQNYWKKYLTSALLEDLKKEKSGIVLNLASNEYSKPIDFKTLKKNHSIKRISPNFKTKKNGKYKTIAIYAKIARGTMTNWIIKNRIEDTEKLKNFSEDSWKFNKELSTENSPTFTR